MYGCAHHRVVLREDADAETREQIIDDTETVLTLIVDPPRAIDRETMLRLGLPASMIERLLAQK